MTVETVLLSLASAIVGGLVVAFANHWMTRTRDIAAKRREMIITELVKIWKSLDDALEIEQSQTKWENFREITQSLQLYGGREEFEAWCKIIQEILERHQRDPDGQIKIGHLLKQLRDKVRGEFGLEALPHEHMRLGGLPKTKPKASV